MPRSALPLVAVVVALLLVLPIITAAPAVAGSARKPSARAATATPRPPASPAPGPATTPAPAVPTAAAGAPPAPTATPTATAAAAVNPLIHLATTEVVPGGRLRVTATNFGRQDSLSVWLTDPAGTASAVPGLTASSRGDAALTVALAATALPGRWAITVQGTPSGRRAIAAFAVVAPRAAPADAPASAPTGTPTPVAAGSSNPAASPTVTATPASVTVTATPAGETDPADPTPTPAPDNGDIAHRLPPPPPGGPVAPHLLRSYFNAAARGTGVPVELLLAVASVESGFNPVAVGPFLPQFAGTENERALGMMQFLPGTYRPYARFVDRVTGKNLGMRGIWDPESAVWAAAFYLRDNGAPGDMRRALLRYNNADWYVRLVIGWADYYARGGTLGSAPVLDRARVASLRDPSVPTLQAANVPPRRADDGLGRSTAINESLATLVLLGLDRPTWPRFSVASRMLPY